MANSSDAAGTMYLEGSWSATDLEYLSLIFVVLQDGNYPLYLDAPNPLRQGDLERYKSEGIPFTAIGRWTFQNNLTNTHIWTRPLEFGDDRSDQFVQRSRDRFLHVIKSTMPNKVGTIDRYLAYRDTLLRSMAQKQLSLRFEYIDCEEGMSLFYRAEDRLVSAPNLDKPGTFMFKIVGIYFEEVADTIYNRFKYMDYEEFDIRAMLHRSLLPWIYEIMRHEKVPAYTNQAEFKFTSKINEGILAMIKDHPTFYDIPWYIVDNPLESSEDFAYFSKHMSGTVLEYDLITYAKNFGLGGEK